MIRGDKKQKASTSIRVNRVIRGDKDKASALIREIRVIRGDRKQRFQPQYV